MDSPTPGLGRAIHGDPPRWVLLPVIATWVGISAAVGVLTCLDVVAGWEPGFSPATLVSVLVVGALLTVFGGYLRRRPLTEVDRTYYRMALVAIGAYGCVGAWWVGAVVAALLLVHSLIDRRTAPDTDHHPLFPGLL